MAERWRVTGSGQGHIEGQLRDARGNFMPVQVLETLMPGLPDWSVAPDYRIDSLVEFVGAVSDM